MAEKHVVIWIVAQNLGIFAHPARGQTVNISPIANIIGVLSAVMGILILLCGGLEWLIGEDHAFDLILDGVLVCFVGTVIAFASAGRQAGALDRRQSFLLTNSVWVVLPIIGATPFVFVYPGVSMLDALFESMSGLTTTGSTVFHDLNDLPLGLIIWRGLLQWLGGLGIIIVAMIFLPTMRVGGMQFFSIEGFDTQGKLLPRALDISKSFLLVYCALTAACGLSYFFLGMTPVEAAVHAMTTVSTGGFSTRDTSFSHFPGILKLTSTLFMVLASLPLAVFVQVTRRERIEPIILRQVRGYLTAIGLTFSLFFGLHVLSSGGSTIEDCVEAVFNIVTIISGTGYASGDVLSWGSYVLPLLLIVGLVGGCTGSTACSIKVFRWQVVFAAIRSQIRAVHFPSSIGQPKYGDRTLPTDVVASVVVFIAFFLATTAGVAVALELSGLSFEASVTGAWTSVANIGPVFGNEIMTDGSLENLNGFAKLILIFAMLAGRLELLTLYVLFSRRFWNF